MNNSDYRIQDDTSDSDYGEDENENENKNDVFILATVVIEIVENYYIPYIANKPCRTSSQTGYKWVIKIYVFIYLCKKLKEIYHLRGIRKLTIEEFVAIFFEYFRHKFGNRIVQESFQHSGETVNRYFTRVLMAVSRMTIDIINPIDREFRDVPSKIRNDDRYCPYFKDCIEAIDGTHVPVKISPSKQIPYIGRKGTSTQNVITVCNFHICFTFIWTGWEGTVHDTRIFFEDI
jgi:hypothetical protein